MGATGPLVLAVDQGTSGTTCLAVTTDGDVVARAHQEVAVRYPRDGWVEQDAMDLWTSVVAAASQVVRGLDRPPVAIGITNQRETLVVFDRGTLEPVAPAIVWQCRRSAALCDAHRAAGRSQNCAAAPGCCSTRTSQRRSWSGCCGNVRSSGAEQSAVSCAPARSTPGWSRA